MGISEFLGRLGIISQMPLLQICVDNQQFSITDPNVYIGTNPPSPLEKSVAAIEFVHPHPVGVNLTLLRKGHWIVLPADSVASAKVVDGHGDEHSVYELQSRPGDAIWRKPFCSLTEGLNRLLFDDLEISLIVPSRNMLRGGQIVHLKTKYQETQEKQARQAAFAAEEQERMEAQKARILEAIRQAAQPGDDQDVDRHNLRLVSNAYLNKYGPGVRIDIWPGLHILSFAFNSDTGKIIAAEEEHGDLDAQLLRGYPKVSFSIGQDMALHISFDPRSPKKLSAAVKAALNRLPRLAGLP